MLQKERKKMFNYTLWSSNFSVKLVYSHNRVRRLITNDDEYFFTVSLLCRCHWAFDTIFFFLQLRLVSSTVLHCHHAKIPTLFCFIIRSRPNTRAIGLSLFLSNEPALVIMIIQFLINLYTFTRFAPCSGNL
jgi:hypothetical protein